PYSVPTDIASLFGASVGPGVRHVTSAIMIAVLVFLLVRTWRGADWISSAGWAAAALALAQFEPMPWYVVWSLPFAALGRSGAQRRALACAGRRARRPGDRRSRRVAAGVGARARRAGGCADLDGGPVRPLGRSGSRGGGHGGRALPRLDRRGSLHPAHLRGVRA